MADEVKKRPGSTAPVAAGEVKRRPGSATPAAPASVSGAKGYLSDPVLDAKAYAEAKKMDEISQEGYVGQVVDNATFNLSRPIQGAVSWVKGDGYDYGKAVDRYMDDFRSERTGPIGSVLGFGGSMMAPGAAVSKGVGAGKAALIYALSGGATSALEGENLATEGDQRTWADRAVDTGLGATISGLLGGAGRAMTTDAITAPQSNHQLNKAIQEVLGGETPPTVEQTGLNFRDALKTEQGDLKNAGKKAMREATKADVTFTGRPDYEAVRTRPDAQTIPLTPEGTPAAFALKQQVDALGDTMTLKQIDELRTQARGLRATAANDTDRGAIDDIVKSLDIHMDANLAAPDFAGDPKAVAQYKKGRADFETALKLESIKGLKAILKDDTIPGKAIADSLLDMNTSSKSKSPAKIISTIVETLGEGSKTLAAARQGVLAKMFNDIPDNPQAQEKLLKTLSENEILIGELFTPEQRQAIAKVQIALEATKGARKGDLSYSKNAGLISDLLGKFNTPAKRAGGILATGVFTGNPAHGAAAALGSLALDAATSVPARRAALAAGRAVGPLIEKASGAAGRYVANPRDAMIDELGRR